MRDSIKATIQMGLVAASGGAIMAVVGCWSSPDNIEFSSAGLVFVLKQAISGACIAVGALFINRHRDPESRDRWSDRGRGGRF